MLYFVLWNLNNDANRAGSVNGSYAFKCTITAFKMY